MDDAFDAMLRNHAFDEIFGRIDHVKRADYLWMYSDDHGDPPLTISHVSPIIGKDLPTLLMLFGKQRAAQLVVLTTAGVEELRPDRVPARRVVPVGDDERVGGRGPW